MYIQPNKQRTDVRAFYVAIAVIAAVLILMLIVVSPAIFAASNSPAETAPPSTTPPLFTEPPVTSDILPPVTEELPFDTGTDTVSSPVSETPVIEIPSGVILPLTEDAGQEYIDKIVFFGDSTTYSLLAYGVLSGGKESLQVWTPAARTLTLDRALTTTVLYPETNEEITLSEALKAKKPEIFIITLGVNGISFMEEEYFITVYEKLVKLVAEASPNTKIILQSIFPVAENWEKQESINNTKIRAANEWIKGVAEKTGVSYLDTFSVLAVAEDGSLPLSYQNGDGLHLNEISLPIVLDYIRTHALSGYAEPIASAE